MKRSVKPERFTLAENLASMLEVRALRKSRSEEHARLDELIKRERAALRSTKAGKA